MFYRKNIGTEKKKFGFQRGLTLVVNLGRAAHELLQPLLASLKQDPPRVTDLRRQANYRFWSEKRLKLMSVLQQANTAGGSGRTASHWKTKISSFASSLLVLDKLPPYPYSQAHFSWSFHAGIGKLYQPTTMTIVQYQYPGACCAFLGQTESVRCRRRS